MGEFIQRTSTPMGLVLMTALPPTHGHRSLIEFAHNFMAQIGGSVNVLINSRSFEPISGHKRLYALENEFNEIYYNNIGFYLCEKDDVPQLPHHHDDFWNVWKNIITQYTHNDNYTHIFASEPYGIEVAKLFDAKFIPYDMHRSAVFSRGTSVRNFPAYHFNDMLPSIQIDCRKITTFFGQESVGKSTMTGLVFKHDDLYKVTRVPEWARDYLEQNGPEINDEKMETIIEGQYALQITASKIPNKHFILQDTDLLSTLGYYKLWKGSWPNRVEELFKISKSNLYILMNDKIPFEPDILRYGKNKRESEYSFWKQLLEDFDCNYYEVKSVDKNEQVIEIESVLDKLFLDGIMPLTNFKREV